MYEVITVVQQFGTFPTSLADCNLYPNNRLLKDQHVTAALTKMEWTVVFQLFCSCWA